MKAFKVGQHVNHGQFGLGTILSSDESHTSIDFVDHGTKLFVTSLVKLEPAANQPPPTSKRSRRTRTASAKRRLTKAATH